MIIHRPFTRTSWPVIALFVWSGAMLAALAVTTYVALAVGVSWPQLAEVAWLAVLPR